MGKEKLYIVGAGMGDYSQITGQGLQAIGNAEVIYAFGRIATQYMDEFPEIISCEYTTIIERLREEKHKCIAVLVSGDVGFFSMAKTLHRQFEKRYEISNICGINSMQYLCARMGISYENMHVLSLHGRDSISKLLGGITYNEYTFLLTGGQNTTGAIMEYLKKHLMMEMDEWDNEEIRITIGDNLSMKRERIVTGKILELYRRNDFSDLTVMVIYNPNYKPKNQHYRDEMFIRSNVPMSKRDIRNLSVDYLDIKSSDIVYDIGAGTGSVTIELASFANEGMVYAVEKNPEAHRTLQRNVAKFRSYNVRTFLSNALEIIGKLPVPDKVFIGGSSGELPEILGILFERNPRIEVLITAITLETIQLAMQTLQELNLDYEVTCINSSYSKKLGGYHLMTAHNPIYLILAKQGED